MTKCLICNKQMKILKRNNHFQKYHKRCIAIFKGRLQNERENPRCVFYQNGACVNIGSRIDIHRKPLCTYEPRDKCPLFKTLDKQFYDIAKNMQPRQRRKK